MVKDEQAVYTDPDGKVWHPHRGYWCWKVSSELAQAQERIKELEAQLAVAEREPVAFVRTADLDLAYLNGMRGIQVHLSIKGGKHFSPLYLDPPPTSELEAENARLRKALEPLVKLADAVFRDGMNTDKRDEHGVWGFDEATLTYGHLRAALRVREGGKTCN